MPRSPERADGVERWTNLPAHRPTLIGRAEAQAAVRRLLLEADQGLVTLLGTGGCGKTQLALAVAASLLDEFPDGVFVSDLAPLLDPGLVAGVVAASTGIAEQSGQPIRDTLLERLRAQSMLLVLDNCGHLVEASAALADDLLGACPRLRILATSREPLHINRERVWRVPPLTIPDLGVETVPAELARNPAVQLFVDRARALEPAFALNAQNSPDVAAICAKLAGLPLAIELAAARARTLTLNEILARLDASFGLLVGGSRTAPSRQQTMRATLDWSYRLLGANAQRAFERLAVFAGGFDVAAAEAVWFDERGAAPDTLSMLTELVDRSLVLAEPLATGMRYRLLEPVRRYAHDRLKADGAWARSRELHAEYFLALAERAEHGLQSADRDIWLPRLKLDHDNVRAALRRCLDAGDAEIEGGLSPASFLEADRAS